MGSKFNVPPGWPAAEPGWTPPAGWRPDPSWPSAPEGWQFWVDRAEPRAPLHDVTEITAKGHTGTITFDGDFVTISRTGFLARTTIGKGEKRIPVGSITAVQWKPPGAIVNGFISFTVAGGNESRSRFGSQTNDAVRDENSVIVIKKQADSFLALRSAIEQAIANRSAPVQKTPDLADQLGKLARLRDAGVLTEGEFAAKKADLLARL